ncbi:hypothetical protein [Brucella tritici]|uniref:hypothetical protein n=1 Tax=Brucella tritici TaxID=94626 RepID=UPI002000BF77|nr:hypothetical protein [Brucella tritici]
MNQDSKNITDALVEGVRSRFKGDDTPATVEMISEIWIELLLLHDIAGDLTKLQSAGYSVEQKQEAFSDLASNLRKSISQIANNLNSLPAKSTGNNHE